MPDDPHDRNLKHSPAESQRGAFKLSRQRWEMLAARLRKLTSGRKHTASEILLREGRDER
jgi:hypothetical protein